MFSYATAAPLIRSNFNPFDRDTMMTDRMFRLLELHQKLDAAIRRQKANHRKDPLEVARLMKRKTRLRESLGRLLPLPRSFAGL